MACIHVGVLGLLRMSRIYHYTSGASLIGLISKNEFWATDIKFLNDNAEHVSGYQASIEFIENLMRKELGSYSLELQAFYKALLKTVGQNTLGRDTYVVSFAKEKDSVAHWFSYCERNQGYCIGFDESEFFEAGQQLGLSKNFSSGFNDVVYADIKEVETRLEPHLGSEAVVKVIKATADHLAAMDRNDGKSKILGEIFYQQAQIEIIEKIYNGLIFLAGSYKVDSFKHEVERRLILSAKIGSFHEQYKKEKTGVQFRERNGVIFPYIPVPFSTKSIKEIIIGPSGDFELRKQGLEMLLAEYGVNCEISKSKTPLRFT